MQNPAQIRALGEIAIRCDNLEAMFAFYRDIVGLKILTQPGESGIAFFEIGPSYGGHTAVLALFRKDAGRSDLHPSSDQAPHTGARSSLHHLALTVDAADQDALKTFLDAQGIPHKTQTFDWIGWRGVFITDPEGNTVEFVAGGL
ncbi:MAG: VOC family protein [Pseudomonadota bacterium]